MGFENNYLNSVALKMKQGDTFNITVRWTDSNGNPIDTSGYTAHMQMRPTPRQPPVLDLRTGDGITFYESDIVVFASPDKTQNIYAGAYVFDLQVSDGADFVKTILSGTITVIADVTYG